MTLKPIGTQWDRGMRNNIIYNYEYLNDKRMLRAGKNIFNKNDVVPGRLAPNGTIISIEKIVTSNFELIEPNATYITNQSIWYAQYNGEGQCIKWDFVAIGNTFTTERDSVYIRISVSEDVADQLQVEKGNITTTYEPYTLTIYAEVEEVQKARKSDPKSKVYPNLKERLDALEREVISVKPPDAPIIDDDTAEQVFVNEMNRVAALLGVENTTFHNSSGLGAAGQLATPKDLTLIIRHAAGIDELTKVWGAKEYSVIVAGPNPRAVDITTTVQNTAFEQDYTILGGKTGTLGIVHNLAIVAEHKATGHVLAGTILRADNDRWQAMKQLFDRAINIIENNSASPTIDAVGACAILLPNNPLLYTNTDLNEIVLQGNSNRQSPASVTKVLTAMVMLDNVSNLNDTFEYKNRDKVEDSLQFNAGDRVTFRDALYLMLLQSNNTTAKAVARVVGQRIVRARGYV